MGKRKVKGLNRSIKLNIGLVIFLVLFCYICYSAFSIFKKDKVSYYEVVEGNMAVNSEHEGIVIRSEQVENTDRSGYINLFITNGKRVGVGTPVYSIDETGALNTYLSNNSLNEVSLSSENVDKLRKTLSSFVVNYSDDDFSSVYNTKSSISTSLMEYVSYTGADSIDELLAQAGIAYSKVYSPTTGEVCFDIDGFESRTAESITVEDFDRSGYEVAHTKSGQLIEQGSPVYKIVTDETWNILFELSEEEREKFTGLTSMNIRFKGTDISCNADYTQLNTMDGTIFGKLTLDKYMVDFIGSRYLTFDIESEANRGLKIPKSAVVTKTFLIIPKEYLARGGDNVDEGFYKQVLSDTGTTIQYIPMDIYYSTDEHYYIDLSSSSPLQPGDYVVMPGSTETFKLGETASRDGVYNINKGYAVFKQIDVIESNDEYYTVKANQKYGLCVYDHILFDPKGVNEGDFIYQ